MQRRDNNKALPNGTYWQGGKIHDPQGVLTEAPALPDIVAFDVADGEFSFYTKEQFEARVDEWRDELEADGYYAEDMDDVISMTHGDEFFWDWLPKAE